MRSKKSPDLTTDYRVTARERQKIPKDKYNGENSVSTFSQLFDQILFILAGNKDIKSFDKVKF